MDILPIAGGAYVGWRRRQNDKMYARGIRPSFPERHPIFIALMFVPLCLVALWCILMYVVPNYLTWVTSLDKYLGNTGVIDLLGFTAWLWIPGLIAFIGAERRYPKTPPPPTYNYTGPVYDIEHWEPHA